MFWKKTPTPTEQGTEVVQALTAAILEFNETMKRIETKVDAIYQAYEALNEPK